MPSNFIIETPFETRPPRLKDLVNSHIMGDVWLRDSPFGPVTDSTILSQKFELKHSNILRSINKCIKELGNQNKYELDKNLIETYYMAGPEGKLRREKKFEITEFGLALLLLYVNSPKARQISAEILYRFFILQTYVKGLTEHQIGAIKGYYRKQISTKL